MLQNGLMVNDYSVPQFMGDTERELVEYEHRFDRLSTAELCSESFKNVCSIIVDCLLKQMVTMLKYLHTILRDNL